MQLTYDRPFLYPKQFEAIFDERRYALIEASTKAGKTSGCIAWIFEQAMSPDVPGRALARNYWWVAPVSDQAKVAFTRAQQAIPMDLMRVYQMPPRIALVNGSIIWFKSADKPDSLYGDDVYAAVVDEASRMKEESWYAIRSTLTKTSGPVRIIGNVKGRKNWFYRMARQAEAGDPAMGFHRINAFDAVEAGVLPSAEIDDARKRYPEHIFKELYLAEASDDEGNPFGYDAIAKCVGPISPNPPVVWGWDLAKSTDHTVGIALDKQGKVCQYWRFQWPWEETVAKIRKETGNTRALIDSTGVGDPIVERLQRGRTATKIEGFHFTQSSKQKIMEGLSVAIQSKQVTYPEGPIVVELKQFEYEIRPGGGVRYSAPQGMHDDCVCALALAVHAHHGASKLSRYSSLDWVA